MSDAAGLAPAPSNTGRPADNRVSKTQRHRLAAALASVTGLRFSDARAVISERVACGETRDEVEAYLRVTFRMDPTGVTAVRNASRSGGAADASVA